MDKDSFHINDSYSLFVPIDHDLTKSISVDEHGDYIVNGIMSSDVTDEEDDSITPEGMDCSYFLEKGWVKYEHGNNPNQFIGEPIEVKVGRFDHPTLLQSVNGIYVKARLFAKRRLTQDAIQTMQDLQKSNTKRRMGWSIEGGVVERDEETGKILKSIIRNVVLTMNPVNTSTWAELSKSFAKNHALVIDMPMDKSLGTEGMHAVIPQSLEGDKKKKDEDPQQEWINLFRSCVKKALIQKSFGSLLITSPNTAKIVAFDEALSKGLGYDVAESFSEYMMAKHDIVKSIVVNFGGELMSEEAKNSLANLLDADLEELKKSIDLASEEEEELQKSMNEEEDEGENEPDEDEEEEEMEKSLKTDLSKSLASQHGQAFEVSDFLTALTEEIGFGMTGMEKSLMGVTKQQGAVLKSLGTMVEVLQKSLTKIDEMEASNQALKASNDELMKSLNIVLDRPAGRRSVTSQRDVPTLQKSLGGTQEGVVLSKNARRDILIKSMEAGEIPGSTVTRFEADVPLDRLGLPENIQKTFGLI